MPDDYSKSPLMKKLAIKPKTRIAVVNPPDGYALGELPEGTTYSDTLDGAFDWIQLFVKSQEQLDSQLPGVLDHLAPGGILWIAFPRDKKATDLSRNAMFPLRDNFGLQPVANAVVNDEWTAYRLKRADT